MTAAVADAEARKIGLFRLSLIAVLVGIATGFGAVGFRALIGFIHNAAFLGKLSYFYDANLYTPPSPWGPLVILVPVVGRHDRHLPGQPLSRPRRAATACPR